MLQFFHKEYTEYTAKSGKTTHVNVGVIPLNGERNMQLWIGNIVFVDSCEFLAASLDNLMKMRKSGVQKSANAIRHFGCEDVYFENSCYPMNT